MSTSLESVFAEMERHQAQAWPIRFLRELRRQVRYEVRHWPHRSRLAVKHASQRLRRGWDDKGAWNLNYSLPSILGAQLIHLGEIAHGYPPEYDGGFDSYVADLTVHGRALVRFGEDRVEDFDDESLYANAQIAMRWVAENLGSLWD
jgi:hypothetical protein